MECMKSDSVATPSIVDSEFGKRRKEITMKSGSKRDNCLTLNRTLVSISNDVKRVFTLFTVASTNSRLPLIVRYSVSGNSQSIHSIWYGDCYRT